MTDDVRITFGATIDAATGPIRTLSQEIGSIRTSALDAAAGALSGFEKLGEGIEKSLTAITSTRGAFREFGEAVGLAFAVEQVTAWTHEMAVAGETALNTAAAMGTTVERFSELSGAIKLTGGSGETLIRVTQMLARNIEESLQKPISKASDAFSEFGITTADLKDALPDPTRLVFKLADGIERLTAAGRSTDMLAGLRTLLGRGGDGELLAAAKDGEEGLNRWIAKYKETGAALTTGEATDLASIAEKINLLKAATQGLGKILTLEMQTPIKGALQDLTDMIEKLDGLKAFNAPISVELSDAAKARLSQAAKTAAMVAPEGGVPVTNFAVTPRSMEGVTVPLPPRSSGFSDSADRHETAMNKADAEIASMMRHAGQHLQKACAELVNEALKAAGLPTSGSNLASSFKNYGTGVRASDVRAGDIFYAGPSGGGDTGHVGITMGGVQNGRVQVVSSHMQGDQSNPAGVEWRDASNLTFRRPGGSGGAPASDAQFNSQEALKTLEALWQNEEKQAKFVNDYAALARIAQERLDFQNKSTGPGGKQEEYLQYIQKRYPGGADAMKAQGGVDTAKQAQQEYEYHQQFAQLTAQEDAQRRAGDFAGAAQTEAQKSALVAGYAHSTAAERIAAEDRVKAAQDATAKQQFSLASEQAASDVQAAQKGLAVFKAGLEQKLAVGQITATQLVGFEISAAQQTYEVQSAALQQLYGLENERPEQIARINKMVEALNADHLAAMAVSAKDYVQKQQAEFERMVQPIKTAFDGIGSSIEHTLNSIVTGAAHGRDAMKQLEQSITGNLLSGIEGVASKAAAGPLASFLNVGVKEGGGIGDVLSSFVGKQLFGDVGKATESTTLTTAGTTLTTAGTTLNVAGGALQTAAASLSAGGAGAGAAGAGGLLGSLGGDFGGGADAVVAALSHGGVVRAAAGGMVVPAAAGGWKLPGSFGTDFVLSALTPNETVLPVGEKPSMIAQHLGGMMQEMMKNGAGGGDINVHLGAGGQFYDWPAFHRGFMQNGGKQMIIDAVRQAFGFRKGAPLSF